MELKFTVEFTFSLNFFYFTEENCRANEYAQFFLDNMNKFREPNVALVDVHFFEGIELNQCSIDEIDISLLTS